MVIASQKSEGREIDDLMVFRHLSLLLPFYFSLISNSCSGGCLHLGGIFLLEFIFSVNVLTGLLMGVFHWWHKI